MRDTDAETRARYGALTSFALMTVAYWSLLLGVLPITMVLIGTRLVRLPLSSAMIYLGEGYALGPGGLDVITPDPMLYADMLKPVAEVAVLIALFSVGLKMGVPLSDRRWMLPLRLASLSMAITVGLIAAARVWGLNLPLGAAVLVHGVSVRPLMRQYARRRALSP